MSVSRAKVENTKLSNKNTELKTRFNKLTSVRWYKYEAVIKGIRFNNINNDNDNNNETK